MSLLDLILISYQDDIINYIVFLHTIGHPLAAILNAKKYKMSHVGSLLINAQGGYSCEKANLTNLYDILPYCVCVHYDIRKQSLNKKYHIYSFKTNMFIHHVQT